MEWYEMLNKRKIVVLDTETGGLTPDCAITSVAAVMVDEEFNIIRSVYTIVNDPSRELTEKALELTGFTREAIAEYGVSVDEMHKMFLPIFNDADILVGHNIDFDLKFLNSYGFALDKPVIDTMHVSWDVWKYPALARLGEVCKRVGIDASGAHNSYDDVIMTLSLLKWFVADGHLPASLPSYPAFIQKEKGRWAHGYKEFKELGYLEED
jgi:DNA polymerase III subunit epsilon